MEQNFNREEYEKYLLERKKKNKTHKHVQNEKLTEKSYLECLIEGAEKLNSRKELDSIFQR